MRAGTNSISLWIILFLCLAAPASLAAQRTSAPQVKIRGNPDRPTVADPADITEYGVLEIEYGWNHSWLGQQMREDDFGPLMKFVAFCDLEIRCRPDTQVSQGGQARPDAMAFTRRFV